MKPATNPRSRQQRRERYRHHCESESSVPIFSQAWWLDVVAPELWDVVLVETNGVVMGSMPFVTSRKYGLTVSSQPALTQTLGPWVRPSEAIGSKALSHQFSVLSQLAGNLPAFDRFVQNWHFAQTNWLPFFWEGFTQTTRYTYRIEDLSDMEAIWSNLRTNIRTDIRKATSRFNLRVRTDLPLSSFLRLNRMVFERQGIPVPYDEHLVIRIDNACALRGERKVFLAEDENGQLHAGVYLIWDEHSAYYLLGGSDPDLRNSGATSLCLWSAIQHSAVVTQSFDFEGSMIQAIERFCRGFGAEQTPYFQVKRTTSRRALLLETARALRKR